MGDAGSAPERQWHESRLGVFVLAVDVLLVGAVAVGTTGALAGLRSVVGLGEPVPAVTVPAYVYVYGAFGALAYVFTRIVREMDRSTTELVHSNLRVLAALPLAAGLYLFAERLLGTAPATGSLAGLAFLTGLFVNTAYHRINALAKRLFPASERKPETAGKNRAATAASQPAAHTPTPSTNDGRSGESAATPNPDGGQRS